MGATLTFTLPHKKISINLVETMTSGKGYDVTLYVYDLSQGMAKQFSPALVGEVIEGIWHTAIVVYGTEYC